MKHTEAFNAFNRCLSALDGHPPSWNRQPEREQAFLEMGRLFEEHVRPDGLFDLRQKPHPLWQQIEQRLDRATTRAQQRLPERSGLGLWQLYNAGFLIQRDDLLFGVDLVPLPRAYGWEDACDLTEKLAASIDFLLVTHRHSDHHDATLVRRCLNLGKPVFMPEEAGQHLAFDPNLHLCNDETCLGLCDMEIIGRRAVHTWRKSIDDVQMICYEVVMPNGKALLITGDADYTKAPFRKTPGRPIDTLFLTWRNPNERYEDGRPEQIGTLRDAVSIALDRTEPERLILEHYGELEHIQGGFPASYDMAVRLKNELPVATEWLFWGEYLALA